MSEGALRYVVLRHDGIDAPHFDLMLETAAGGPLWTWRLHEWPVRQRARIEKLPDHRPAYLEYEGPVGGDRGTVTRVASGTFRLEADPEFNSADRLNWQVYFKPPAHGEDDALLIRRWVDPSGRECWDAAQM